MDGLVFGIVDNGILILCAYTGLGIERLLPKRFQTGIGAIYGAGIGNALSDALGAVLDPTTYHLIVGITCGCLIPLLFIPIISFLQKVLRS